MIPLFDLKYVRRAEIYKAGELAGSLTRNDYGGVRFLYDPRYDLSELPQIATSLPAEASGFETRSGALPAFFSNLLPEGVRLLGLKDRLKASLDDELTLLLAVGRDVVGDVIVVPEDEDPDTSRELTEPISDFGELFRRASEGDDPVAIAGVQEKVSSSMLMYPSFRKRGPAIVKLGPPRLPLLVENEYFFLRMAKACGIKAANAELIRDESGQTALWVDRFDRIRDGQTWKRVAQEDGCQLIGRYPAGKYSISVREITEVFWERAVAPPKAMTELLSQLAFAYLIGNGDQHAKNVSLGMTAAGWMPTPAYDMLSTLPYPLDQKMALKMDGRDDHWNRRAFTAFFGRYGLSEKLIHRTIDRILDPAEKWIDRIDEIGYDGLTTERVKAEIRRRREELGSKS